MNKLKTILLSVILTLMCCMTCFASEIVPISVSASPERAAMGRQTTAQDPYNIWDDIRIQPLTVRLQNGKHYDVCVGATTLSFSSSHTFANIYFNGKSWGKTDGSPSAPSGSINLRGPSYIGNYTVTMQYDSSFRCTVNVHYHELQGNSCKWCGRGLGCILLPTQHYDTQTAAVKTVLNKWGITTGDKYHDLRYAWNRIADLGNGDIHSSDGEKYGYRHAPIVVKCDTKLSERPTDNNGDLYYSFDTYAGPAGWPKWSKDVPSMEGSPDGYAHNYYTIAATTILEHSYSITKYDKTHHWKECGCGNKKDIQTHTLNSQGVCTGCGGKFHTHSWSWTGDQASLIELTKYFLLKTMLIIISYSEGDNELPV